MQVEQIIDRSMAFQKPLCLLDRFETTHASLTNPGGLMGKFCSIVSVLFCVVSRPRNQCSVCNTIAPQFVGNDLSRDTACFNKPLEETFCCLSIPSFLQIDVNHFAILINRAPKVMLFATDLHEHFV